jgi:CRISPR type III-A-associated RAMP protein Csm5
MSSIKIETLTSVHIGSGETLQYGTDFVTGKLDEDYVISIVDPRKVMDLIGEANVHQWVAAIERKEATSKVVKQFAPNSKLEDYSKRIIMEWSETKPTDTLKEQIHDGQGRPYIPGSSIKGAIRTTVLASLANSINIVERKIDKTKYKDFLGNPIPKDKIKYKADAKNIESELFGSNPNEDVFRFLQVGDAYFGDNNEVAIKMVNINERERQSFWDTSKPQLIEAIGPEDESIFQLKLNENAFELSKNRVHAMPECMRSIPVLFETINNHTLGLLNSEIDYWREREADDDTEKVSLYIERINEVLKQAKACTKSKECVLRIGHGSGWRFITGAWTENLDNFYSVVVPASRPKNFKYEQYDFPKTRRVDDECELLGFVKLSICE